MRRTEDPGSGVRSEWIRAEVRARYGAIAARREHETPSGSSCCGATSSCSAGGEDCCGAPVGSTESPSRALGYGAEELASLPPGADLGLGCGNPSGLLSLAPGEIVLDLGSGGGVDCFLAARAVGPRGRVIGVDMTPEMISRARFNAKKARRSNVEFRLGELEHLPVADSSVDVVISNCVVNLVPDKTAVYREAFRVLRPGGRLAISDVVATRPLAEALQKDPRSWGSCVSGAITTARVVRSLRRAGFRSVRMEVRAIPTAARSSSPHPGPVVVPASIRAIKPRARRQARG